ncbi:MAG: ubiquitin-like protein Pup [Acidimicrobiia bacterium]|nr:ubiquitin-like protein Pup [Acidimicrobiia bacterium]
MSDRERGQENKKSEEVEAEDTHAVVESEADLEALDDLLDEIDEVLEENAEEFVKNYVQKGGE